MLICRGELTFLANKMFAPRRKDYSRAMSHPRVRHTRLPEEGEAFSRLRLFHWFTRFSRLPLLIASFGFAGDRVCHTEAKVEKLDEFLIASSTWAVKCQFSTRVLKRGSNQLLHKGFTMYTVESETKQKEKVKA